MFLGVAKNIPADSMRSCVLEEDSHSGKAVTALKFRPRLFKEDEQKPENHYISVGACMMEQWFLEKYREVIPACIWHTQEKSIATKITKFYCREHHMSSRAILTHTQAPDIPILNLQDIQVILAIQERALLVHDGKRKRWNA